MGCGTRTSIFDPLSNAEIASCSTSCGTEEKLILHHGSCNGVGCCTIYMDDMNKEFLFTITRDDQKNNFDMVTVKAFLHLTDNTDYDTFSISQADLLSNDTVGGGHNIPMLWLLGNMTDRLTCNDTAHDTTAYACVSKHSECSDGEENYGYYCSCSGSYEGNPYIIDGCQDLDRYKKDRADAVCRRNCGGIDIPFPFGIEDGCYGKKIFKLNCSGSDLFMTLYRPGESTLSDFQTPVAEILVNDGLLRLEIQSENIYAFLENKFIKSIVTVAVPNLSWFINNVTCPVAKQNPNHYACVSDNSECLQINGSGYRCKCSQGFHGNPYLINGCADIDECRSPIPACNKTLECKNTIGSYYCVGSERGLKHVILGIIVGISGGVAGLLFVMCAQVWVRRLKSDKKKKIRKKNFNKNQGLLLQKLISTEESIVGRSKKFSLEELEIATNNFDQSRILGEGGHGTIYKGILLDQSVVAIKKAKLIKQIEINQFINEVAILSQIVHRNVVKLFGCCLETEVPLLVYEFISNGTLYDKLHKDPSNVCSLIWGDRLRIAIEAAGALCYLHLAASISIFHRDVKSTNILLDDNYTTKVSDFGASRSIPIDQKEVFTAVQGTFGYLDPEYYHTGQLSEKSDVYSFGVIIVELLTRKQPIFTNNLGEWMNLSNYFLQAMRDGSYTELIDVDIREELTDQELEAMINLLEMCLKIRGEERPTMKEVEMRLQFIRSNREKQRQPTQTREEEPLLEEPIYTPNQNVNRVTAHMTNHFNTEKEFIDSMDLPC